MPGGETWMVGRGDSGCYVENAAPVNGETAFSTEGEAVRYAIACDEDTIEPLRENLRHLRSRLRKLKRNGAAGADGEFPEPLTVNYQKLYR